MRSRGHNFVNAPRLDVTPGKGPFRRMHWAPRVQRPAAFALQLPDGTRALVVAGVVVHVEMPGEMPDGWQNRLAADALASMLR